MKNILCKQILRNESWTLCVPQGQDGWQDKATDDGRVTTTKFDFTSVPLLLTKYFYCAWFRKWHDIKNSNVQIPMFVNKAWWNHLALHSLIEWWPGSPWHPTGHYKFHYIVHHDGHWEHRLHDECQHRMHVSSDQSNWSAHKSRNHRLSSADRSAKAWSRIFLEGNFFYPTHHPLFLSRLRLS